LHPEASDIPYSPIVFYSLYLCPQTNARLIVSSKIDERREFLSGYELTRGGREGGREGGTGQGGEEEQRTKYLGLNHSSSK